MNTKTYIVILSVTVELEETDELHAPMLSQVRRLLSERVGGFLYPAGMKVLSAEVGGICRTPSKSDIAGQMSKL